MNAFQLSGAGACLALAALYGMAKDEPEPGGKEYVNSIGIKMVRVPAGSFRMGSDRPTDPAALKQSKLLTSGDYDEKPVHEVRISRAVYLSETEITAEQYARFRFDHQDFGRYSPYATGMSWDEATAFCVWLSRKEKRHYRLPTEAEWEHAARAGSETHFPGGDQPPKDGEANAFGLKNMHGGPAEWVLDWHGLYSPEPQTDPVGPRTGDARVVRGGGIMGPAGREPADGTLPYYRRSANRAGMAPGYREQHLIGFRIVEAPMPATAYTEPEPKLVEQFVKQSTEHVKAAPDPKQPWFRKRVLLPIPPENVPSEAIVAAGLHPSFLGHNHSASLTACPNGDLLAVFFSASTPANEYLSNTSFIATRLRFGASQWDMPSRFYDFPDANDQSSLLWTDRGVVYHFGGGAGLQDVPFRWQSSKDSGATWTPVRFPRLVGPLGGYWPQPISTAFRGPDGAIYMPNDAIGGESMLWASRDEGQTWFDTGGRTAGRHTVFAVLKDGSILGIGGKNTDIDGYMPQAISRDGGRTWTVTKTVFPALGSNQRPSLVRLASGRLFFASDWQSRTGQRPPGITERGSFVALSGDEGKTWTMKTLPGALPHEGHVLKGWAKDFHGDATLGYSVATQAPNGLIYLNTSMNHPSLSFEMNEAWIRSDSTAETALSPASGKLLPGRETYPDGKTQATWTGRTGGAGRYVLSGPETWYYPDGAKQYEVTWRDGVKTGTETYWSAAGRKVWEWDYRTGVWMQYWPNGNKKHESQWKDGRCEGVATAWKYTGEVEGQYRFEGGMLQR